MKFLKNAAAKPEVAIGGKGKGGGGAAAKSGNKKRDTKPRTKARGFFRLFRRRDASKKSNVEETKCIVETVSKSPEENDSAGTAMLRASSIATAEVTIHTEESFMTRDVSFLREGNASFLEAAEVTIQTDTSLQSPDTSFLREGNASFLQATEADCSINHETDLVSIASVEVQFQEQFKVLHIVQEDQGKQVESIYDVACPNDLIVEDEEEDGHPKSGERAMSAISNSPSLEEDENEDSDGDESNSDEESVSDDSKSAESKDEDSNNETEESDSSFDSDEDEDNTCVDSRLSSMPGNEDEDTSQSTGEENSILRAEKGVMFLQSLLLPDEEDSEFGGSFFNDDDGKFVQDDKMLYTSSAWDTIEKKAAESIYSASLLFLGADEIDDRRKPQKPRERNESSVSTVCKPRPPLLKRSILHA
eukprot:CAMPEP_0178740248 /NCGR_PEP_ID=MMETSP0744-20121128/4483_1 /TAXON_ID=913974 /ORGANISM="Nitzschia punctata, Strain CCMP561" /LENGTH=418 /DNA_ID=CAMNT_0020392997 /DNA_START=17 /DNA_END=1273 /DNA_ORIENTATION=-